MEGGRKKLNKSYLIGSSQAPKGNFPNSTPPTSPERRASKSATRTGVRIYFYGTFIQQQEQEYTYTFTAHLYSISLHDTKTAGSYIGMNEAFLSPTLSPITHYSLTTHQGAAGARSTAASPEGCR